MKKSGGNYSPYFIQWLWFVAIVWTLIIGGSLLWNVSQIDHHVNEEAKASASTLFEQNLMFRRWNAMHGGVYVPVTEKTPPNPYLNHLPDRDVTTTTGRKLTMVNPAYMIHQVDDLMFEYKSDVKAHITSLNPLNPENIPDPWEEKALKNFEAGISKQFSREKMADGKAYLRYMRPLMVEKSCLKCHAQQGYELGDIRGGISISIDLMPRLAEMETARLRLAGGHGVIWLLGLAGLFISGRQQHNLEKRTRQDEGRLKLALSIAKQAWFELDVRSGNLIVSPEYAPLIGYKSGNFETSVQNWLAHIHPDDVEMVKLRLQECLENDRPVSAEYRRQHRSGSWIWFRTIAEIIERDIGGSPLRMIGIQMDITEQKTIERHKEESRNLLAKFIEHSPIYAFIKEVSDDESRVIVASDNYEKMLGIPANGMINKEMHELFPKELADKMVADDSKVISDNRIVEVEEELNDRIYSTIKFPIVLEEKTLLASYTIDITNTKESEERILSERNQAKKYFEIAQVMMVVLDSTGAITMLNQKGYEILGYDEGEIVGANWFDLVIPEEHRDEVVKASRKIMSGDIEPLEYYENEVLTKGGERRIVAFHNAILKDDQGKVVGTLSSGEDITERIQIDKIIAESESKYRSLFENMMDGFALHEIVCDEHGKPIDYIFLEVNDAFELMTGLEREKLIGRRVTEALPDSENDPVDWIGRYGKVALSGKEIRFEHYSEALEKWFSILAFSPARMTFATVVEDVSARKEMEAALSDSERSLRRAQTVAHVGSWRYDLNEKMEWSDETYRVFGVSSHEFEPKIESFMKRVHPDDRPPVQAWLERVIHSGHGGVLIFRTIRPDGSTAQISGQVELVNNEAGEPDYLTGTFQDITDRMLLEEQFHHAQKMEALGTLVGGIAHDFNNLLAGMTGNVYLAKSRVKELPDAVEKLEVVEKLSFRAAELIRQLLTFARKDRVVMKTLPLAPFIKETMKFLRSTLPENIAMDLDVKDDPGTVVGDATQLHQVIMNVVNNARDAVEDVEHPEICIELDVIHPDGGCKSPFKGAEQRDYAHLSIKDNGSGISSDSLEHIFEPFFTTKEVGKGTGLGLAMVFGAIQSHHGFIEADSVVGKGTTIHIYLPVEKNEADMTHVIESVGTQTGEGETILLVDDDKDVLETGREVLKAMGYKVLVAKDGEEAVEMFTAHQSDIALIIMDLVMPRMSGTSAAGKIHEKDPDMKIIFCTGYDKGDALPKGKELEDVVIISKPYNIEELSQAIHQELRR